MLNVRDYTRGYQPVGINIIGINTEEKGVTVID